MNIAIEGIGEFSNRGVEALANTTLAGLRKSFPSARLTVLTTDPYVADDQPVMSQPAYAGVQLFPDRRFRPTQAALFRYPRIGRAIARGLIPGVAAQIDLEARLDLLISSGGDNLSSDYGGPAPFLQALHAANSRGVRTAILAQSIGPFRDQRHRSAFVAVARDVSLITTRERATLRYVIDELGLPESKVKLTADTAFLLEPPPAAESHRVLLNHVKTHDRPIIAISISQGISKFASLSREQHRARLAELIDLLIHRCGAHVLLVPHVQDPRPHNNDLILAEALLRTLDWNPMLTIAAGRHTAAQYKGLISQCDFLIAERMHAAIAGLSSSVPTVVLGYSVKARGIMDDIMGVDSTSENLVIPIDTFVASKAIDEAILSHWNQRATLKAALVQGLPDMVRRAQENFAHLESLCSSSSAR